MSYGESFKDGPFGTFEELLERGGYMRNLYPETDPQWAEKTDQLFELLASRAGTLRPVGKESVSSGRLQIIHGAAELLSMLLFKNEKYGNSALDPQELFPTGAPPSTLIRVRINDKLKRLANAKGGDKEDLILDIMGYLLLLRIAEHNERMGTNATE